MDLTTYQWMELRSNRGDMSQGHGEELRDRYQSAQEFAEALERCRSLVVPPLGGIPPKGGTTSAGKGPTWRRRWQAWVATAALAVVVVLGVLFIMRTSEGTLAVEIDMQLGKDVQVAVSHGGKEVRLVDAQSGWTLSLSAGKYDLAVKGGDDQFQLDSESVTVTRGGQVKVRVTRKPARLTVAPFDFKQAREYQSGARKQLSVPVETTNSIGMRLVFIPPGEFMMGSPKELIEEEMRLRGGDVLV